MYSTDTTALYYEMLPTIKYLASSFRVHGMEKDDLEQEFAIVLLRANNNFDPTRGASFKTFFVSSCKNRVKDLWRKKDEIMYTLNQPINDADGGEHIDNVVSDDLLNKPGDYLEMLSGIVGGHVTYRWAMGETFNQIADSLGISLSATYRIHTNVIKTIRDILGITEN